MEIDIKLPELGDGIKSGDILEVLVRPGDVVAPEQGLVEIETDKATVTLPSPQGGRVTHVYVQPGQTVPVGAPLVRLEAAVGAAATAGPPAASPAEVTRPATAPAAPAPAAAPSPPMPAAPPTPTVGSPAAERTVAPPASRVPPAGPVPAATAQAPPVAASSPPTSTAAASAAASPLAAGPAVRRFAREVGVDLADVPGTGSGGRITREDVLAAVRAANQLVRHAASSPPPVAPASALANPAAADVLADSPPAPSVAEPPPPSQQDAWGAIRVEKLTRIRRTIAQRMHESWSTVPRVTNFDDADVTELERIRQASKDDYAARGIKLTTLPFVIKSVAMALRANPVLNASIDLDAGTVIYKQYINIGVAIDSERGLVVPSLRGADQLSISEIARQLAALANKVRDNTFSIDELRGSSFTVSNLGAIGGTYSTPIVNTPEVAILLVGRSRRLPVVVDDQIVPRLMMPLSLSYDHRLVDGAAAARFLNDVIAYLRAPGRLLLAP